MDLIIRCQILKSAEGNPNSTRRYFFDYTEELAGYGRIIHTYQNDENPLPSFEGEPVLIQLVKNHLKHLHNMCGKSK